MRLFWRMGWRNVWRNTRRSVITVSALAFSVALLIFFFGMMASYVTQMEENIIGMSLGHVQVHHPQYLADQNLYQLVDGASALLSALEARGLAAAPRCYGYGLLASDRTGNSAGVRLKGVELEQEARVTTLSRENNLFAGRYLTGQTRVQEPQTADAAPVAGETFVDPLADELETDLGPATLTVGEMVIGKKLAATLGVRPGDTVNVVTMAADGTIGNELFDVVGVFKNFSEIEDRSLALITLADYRRLFNLPAGQVHEIAVRLDENTGLDEGKAMVAEVVGPAGETKTWKEIEPPLAEMLDYMLSASWIFMLTMYVGAAMLIMNSMLMMVFERIREFGVMKALGLKGSGLVVLVYCETFWLCLVAAAVGAAVGAPLTAWIGQVGIDLTVFAPDGFALSGTVLDPVLRAELTGQTLLFPVISLFVISFLAVLYPAVKAAVIEPVKALSTV